MQFSKLVTSAVIVNGNILIQAGGGFKVQTNGNPSPTGNFVHTLDLKGNLTHNGNLLDFRSGSAGTTLAVCNLTLSGSSNNTLTVNTPYSSTNGDFNAVTINMTGAAKVILGSNIVMSGGSSSGPAVANTIMTFVNGIIETGNYVWICQTSTEANVVGYSSTSYIKGAMGRGMSNSGASSKNFPIGDATGFRPFKLYSSTGGTSTGHYAIVRCVTGNANTGTSTFNSLVDKVSEVRYYEIGYNNSIGGAASMGFKNFRPSYGTNDGVIAGNTDLRVAYSSDARATWNGITQAVAHTTVITDSFTVITPDTLGNAPNGSVVTLTSGSSMYVALARATGTTTNPLSSPKVLTLTALIEGFYDGSTMVSDSVTVELRNTSPGYTLVDQTKVVLNTSGNNAAVNFFTATDATNYYIVVKHRNSIETWSANPQSFSGGTLSYDFTSSSGQAYGSNMIQKNTKWCIFGGDMTSSTPGVKDGLVDGSDLAAVDNDNTNFITGYVVTDLTGEQIVDGSDLAIVDNNNTAFVGKVVPPGALTAKRTKQPVTEKENK